MNSFFLSDAPVSPLNVIPSSIFVDREHELNQLAQQLFRRNNRLVFIVGPGGIGKTRLAVEFARRFADNFSGGFVGIYPTPMSSLSETALDALQLQKATSFGKESLLVIDDIDRLPDEVVETELTHILGAIPNTRIIATSRREIRMESVGTLGLTVRLAPFDQQQVAEYIHQTLGSELAPSVIKQLYQRLQGYPLSLTIAANAIRDGLYDAPELIKSLEPFRREGLLGPDGRPIRPESESYKDIMIAIRGVSDELLNKLAEEPKLLYELSPRLFEQVVAELLARMGYDVTLTPASRDGGKDIYAASRNEIGSFLYIVECKKYSPDNLVGVALVRQLYGVVQAEKATAGILATTSFFTKDAKEFQGQVAFQISLRDYLGIQKWLQSAQRWDYKPQEIKI